MPGFTIPMYFSFFLELRQNDAIWKFVALADCSQFRARCCIQTSTVLRGYLKAFVIRLNGAPSFLHWPSYIIGIVLGTVQGLLIYFLDAVNSLHQLIWSPPFLSDIDESVIIMLMEMSSPKSDTSSKRMRGWWWEMLSVSCRNSLKSVIDSDGYFETELILSVLLTLILQRLCLYSKRKRKNASFR